MNENMFGIVQQNVMMQRPKAAIYFFSPRHVYDVAQRSFLVNMSQNIVDDMIAQSEKQTLASPATLSRYIKNNVVVPSATKRVVTLSHFSECWTFTAIVDDSEVSLFDPAAKPNKIIFSGYCVDEPISELTRYSSTPTLNPNCILRPLNVIKLQSISGAFGMVERVGSHIDIPRTLQDMIRHDDPSLVSADRQLYRTNSSACMKTVTNSTIPTGIQLPVDMLEFEYENNPTLELSAAQVAPNFEVMKADTNIPSEFLRDIIVPAYNSVSTTPRDFGASSQMIASNIMNDMIVNDTILDETVRDFSLGGQILLSSFMNRYQPQWQKFEVPPVSEFGSISADITSPVSIFANLLQQVMPSYLYHAGLSSIGFTYDSYYRVKQIQKADCLVPMDANTIQKRIENMFVRLELDIFEMIRSANGEFVVSVMVNPNAQTVIDLRFSDDYTYFDCPYVGETIFKGYTDLTYGGVGDLTHNANEIHSMIGRYAVGRSMGM